MPEHTPPDLPLTVRNSMNQIQGLIDLIERRIGKEAFNNCIHSAMESCNIVFESPEAWPSYTPSPALTRDSPFPEKVHQEERRCQRYTNPFEVSDVCSRVFMYITFNKVLELRLVNTSLAAEVKRNGGLFMHPTLQRSLVVINTNSVIESVSKLRSLNNLERLNLMYYTLKRTIEVHRISDGETRDVATGVVWKIATRIDINGRTHYVQRVEGYHVQNFDIRAVSRGYPEKWMLSPGGQIIILEGRFDVVIFKLSEDREYTEYVTLPMINTPTRFFVADNDYIVFEGRDDSTAMLADLVNKRYAIFNGLSKAFIRSSYIWFTGRLFHFSAVFAAAQNMYPGPNTLPMHNLERVLTSLPLDGITDEDYHIDKVLFRNRVEPPRLADESFSLLMYCEWRAACGLTAACPQEDLTTAVNSWKEFQNNGDVMPPGWFTGLDPEYFKLRCWRGVINRNSLNNTFNFWDVLQASRFDKDKNLIGRHSFLWYGAIVIAELFRVQYCSGDSSQLDLVRTMSTFYAEPIFYYIDMTDQQRSEFGGVLLVELVTQAHAASAEFTDEEKASLCALSRVHEMELWTKGTKSIHSERYIKGNYILSVLEQSLLGGSSPKRQCDAAGRWKGHYPKIG